MQESSPVWLFTSAMKYNYYHIVFPCTCLFILQVCLFFDAIIPHTICAIQEQFSIRMSCRLIVNKSHERTEENRSACFLKNAFGLQRQRRVEGVEPSNKAERRYLTLKPLLRSAEWGSCQVRRLKSWTLRANTSIQMASIVQMF